MTTIYLDIETERAADVPPEELAELEAAHPRPEPPPADPFHVTGWPSGWRDPEKIAAWQAERHARLVAEYEAWSLEPHVEAWRESTSLEPLYGRILCVGAAVDDRPAVCVWEADEAATLTRLSAALARYNDAQFVAYNGDGFDFRYLWARALHHHARGAVGMAALARRMFKPKPWSETHVDPKVQWQRGEYRAKGTLAQVARHLGIDVPHDPLTGGEVPRLWDTVRDLEPDAPERVAAQAAIRHHCVTDVEVLRRVWEIMREGVIL